MPNATNLLSGENAALDVMAWPQSTKLRINPPVLTFQMRAVPSFQLTKTYFPSGDIIRILGEASGEHGAGMILSAERRRAAVAGLTPVIAPIITRATLITINFTMLEVCIIAY